ncbi:intraflagellar transport protein 46 homolog isoform X2 [Mytilus galloprovincialis]|uniref:intraflagellar transport protein 46 homolog isoform X2 n=1 Tax=Mytilus edulis TaxID=6550 RepID=UPI0039EFB461
MEDDYDEERENAKHFQNQPYDEALEVPDGEEVASTYSPTPRVHHPSGIDRLGRPVDKIKSAGSTPPEGMISAENSEEDEEYDEQLAQQQHMQQEAQQFQQQHQQRMQQQQLQSLDQPPRGGNMMPVKSDGQFNSEDEETGSETTEEDDDDDDEDDDDEHVPLEGAYDPGDYENLPVSPEIKELFQYITRYTPQSIELENKLKPFIPDFIPAVGDIDAFVKIIRPDSKPDTLGLTVLDEPCAKQSDPTVLDLQLRAISKQSTDRKVVVKSLESAERNPKAIDNWIESIRDLHRTKPPPNVHYSKNMPDIDLLMQEWPPEFEELLKEVGLPTADLDCDLSEYVEIVCSILDIPIYKGSSQHNSKIQALHVLFTLYSEFKNSQHFRALADENKLDNALKDDDYGGGGGMGGEQLIL